MNQRILLATAVSIAISGSASMAQAFLDDLEVTIELKNETAVFIKDGPTTSEPRATNDDSHDHDAGDLMKFENSARFFINGDVGEDSSWHAELNMICDSEGETWDYKCHRTYTQHDWLRELYIDTQFAGWDLRLGKQQVVWGTADGIKLLDIINPTDYRELNQNAMESSRIPIWMINAERNVGDRGNVQLIVSQAETNKVPGLWTQDDGAKRTTIVVNGASPTGFAPVGNGQIRGQGQDRGQPFVMKGVDVITGGVNGFFNIGAEFGSVTHTFYGGGFTNPADNPSAEGFTVAGFTALDAAAIAGGFGLGCGSGQQCLEAFTEMTNNNVTNLIDVNLATDTGWNIDNPNSAWEHFPNATFATFNSMVGMTTEYRRDYDDDAMPSEANFGGRFRSYLDNGLNYSVNYFYAYDPNPSLNIHWEDPNSGQRLVVDKYAAGAFADGKPIQVLQIRNPVNNTLYGAASSAYGSGAADVDGTGGPAKLVFVEDRNRIHNLGGSLDYAFDAAVPVILRGEFLYQKDVNQPVVDRQALANGDLVGALKSEKHDFFKYVIGADVTVFTNLLVSGQFIQFRNLDYVEETAACATQDPPLPDG